MKGNACEYLPIIQENWMTFDECQTSLNGLPTQGLFSILEQLHTYSLEVYDYYQYLLSNYPITKYFSMYLAVFNNERVITFQWLFRGLVHPLLLYLRDMFITSVNQNISQYQTYIFISLIVYCVCLLIYQFIVTLFVYMENKQVLKIC